MKRPFAHGFALLLLSFSLLSTLALADSPKLRVEVMDTNDVLVILTPDTGAEPSEVLSDMAKLENVLNAKLWRRDLVEVVIGKKLETRPDVVASVEKLFAPRAVERLVIYKAKGNFITQGEKLPVLKEVKAPKKK